MVSSPDHRRVLTLSYDKTARVWDMHTGKALSLPLQHARPVHFASFTPDGRQFLTCSDVVRVWDLAAVSGAPAHALRNDTPSIHDFVLPMVFSPDRRRYSLGAS